MYYSAIVALAIMILSFENHDILFTGNKEVTSQSGKVYKNMLYAVLAYYIIDMLWGLLYFYHLKELLYIDTLIYYITMGLGVFCWTQYVTQYINESNIYSTVLKFFGQLFCISEILIVCINMFVPILFSIDDTCEYHGTILRHIMLIIQIILLFLVSIFAISFAINRQDQSKKRHRTIAWFGIIMGIFLMVQLWNPLLPLYSVAYLLGTCLLHTFVINDEKEEYKLELEKSLQRERHQYEELKNTRVMAYRDPLTGVKSKSAYNEVEVQKNIDINEGTANEFAIAVFDLNGLKYINDTFGHEKGDEFIRNGCKYICKMFKHSPVFRIGGDEFVVLLENADFDNREALKDKFNSIMDAHDGVEEVIVAIGMSDFIAGTDTFLNDVFARADQQMYIRKNELKRKK